MTTTELIATLKLGAPVTARLVREIIDQLAAFQWTRQTLQTVLDRYAHGKITLTEQESGYVCEALAECDRLKEAVAWLMDCHDAYDVAENYYHATREAADTFALAKKEVEELL